MYILPYKINSVGDMMFYLDIKYHNPRLFKQPTYLDAKVQTKLNNNLLLVKIETSPKQSKKVSVKILKSYNIKPIKPYYSLLDFINENNRTKVERQLKTFRNQIIKYVTLDIDYPKFTQNQENRKDRATGINYVIIPKNTNIYKAMPHTPYNTNNNRNPRALKSAWFSSLETAKKYAIIANLELKKKKIEPKSPEYWRVYAFKFVKTVKLFYLMDFNNLYLTINKQKSIIGNAIDRATVSYSSSRHTPSIDMKKVDRSELNIRMVKMLTGFQATYRQQLNYIKNIHPVFKRKIAQSEVELLNHFYNHERKNRSKKVRYKIDKSYHSDLSYDLNRISIGTELDRHLLRAIQESYDYDGYINHITPSIWEFGRYTHNKNSATIPTLDEEIGLFTQRGVIKRVRDDPYDDRIFL